MGVRKPSLSRISEGVMGIVKCAECGFLAMRHEHNRGLVEAERITRVDGFVPEKLNVEKMPLCFLMLIDFRAHIAGAADEQRRDALNAERECADFTPWRQGFSPKEHQEMLDRQWMLDFQTRREDADRTWRQECDDRNREWQENQAAIADKRHTQSLWIAMIAAAIGAVATLLAVKVGGH